MNRMKTAASVLALSLAFMNMASADDAKPNRAHIVELEPGVTAQHMIEIEKNGPVFIFLKAYWCGWCKKMEPILKEAFAERYPDGMATLVIADIDEHPELKNNHGVPQLIPYRGLIQKGEAMMGVPDEVFPDYGPGLSFGSFVPG